MGLGPAIENVSEASQLPLAVTMGDPSGIGLEVAMRAWQRRTADKIPCFVLFADLSALEERALGLGLKVSLREISTVAEAVNVFDQDVPVIQVPLSQPAIAGKPDVVNAQATIRSIDQAVAAVAAGKARGVVTNPIAKEVLYTGGFAYPGHTEFLGALAKQYFAKEYQSEPVMMLACEALRVVPVTIHMALKDVAKMISHERIVSVAKTTDNALRSDFGIAQPRIAMTGLNPHAGEAGTMGQEETDIIRPAIETLRGLGLHVTGPHAADSLFHEDARQTYDAAITMYHDQALIPFKTLAFETGVNITLGLPFVRTSPDHGTAFDLAPLGRASPRSFIESLNLADVVACNRSKVAV